MINWVFLLDPADSNSSTHVRKSTFFIPQEITILTLPAQCLHMCIHLCAHVYMHACLCAHLCMHEAVVWLFWYPAPRKHKQVDARDKPAQGSVRRNRETHPQVSEEQPLGIDFELKYLCQEPKATQM